MPPIPPEAQGDALLWLLSLVLVAAGVAGTVLPALPGAPLVLAGLVLAASIDGFARVGWVTLAVLGLLTLASLAVDLGATALGAKRVGASKRAILGAAVGTVVGFFVGFGLPGLLLAAVGKLAIVFAMIGLFAASYYF